jgi:dephospho-CoA kinase
MSSWPGKYVIGLTGNIATGKSVVRKMLEHLGAYGIDADGLGHRAIARKAPGYKAVVETFGHWILGSNGEIDRPRLGRLVFADSEALESLEAIVHPLVRQAVDILVRRVPQKVVVLEAIKLLESNLSGMCDAVWVTYTPEEMQIERLVRKRQMGKAEARLRIESQSAQEVKLAEADVVIRNDGSFEETWHQVVAAWRSIFPTAELAPERVEAARGELVVQRGGPGQAEEIARLINRLSDGRQRLSRSDVMAAFGEKAFLLLELDRELKGLVGWQVENLVARTNDVYLDRKVSLSEGMSALMKAVERASRELQCEASLLFLNPDLARQETVWKALGYEHSSIDKLSVRAWQEAARESMPEGTVMLFKRLREDRVLRPV